MGDTCYNNKNKFFFKVLINYVLFVTDNLCLLDVDMKFNSGEHSCGCKGACE